MLFHNYLEWRSKCISCYADDSMTTEIDGFTPNSEMFFAQTEDGTIHQLSATYNENPPFSALWLIMDFHKSLLLI